MIPQDPERPLFINVKVSDHTLLDLVTDCNSATWYKRPEFRLKLVRFMFMCYLYSVDF